MTPEDDAAPVPVIHVPAVPGGTRWIKVTSPHPGQVIKVKKSNDLSVFYVQEKPGTSQSRVGGTHRSDRDSFMRDYEPYTKRDWQAAQKLMASLDVATETAVDEPVSIPSNGHVDIPAPEESVSDERPEHGALVTESVSPQQGEEITETSPEEGEAAIETVVPIDEARPRRSHYNEIPEAEQDEIVQLWRADEPVTDIANTYNTTAQIIYACVSARVPEEYRLRRVVDQLKREGKPIPAYRVSQWMHLKKTEVEALCTSEAAQQVLRYTVETLDPSKPWIKTPMVELLPPTPPQAPVEPAVQPEEEPVAAPATPSVQFAITTPEVEPVQPSAPQTPVRAQRTWRVVIRTTVEDRVQADDIASAIEAAKAKYQAQARTAEVVGVMEE